MKRHRGAAAIVCASASLTAIMFLVWKGGPPRGALSASPTPQGSAQQVSNAVREPSPHAFIEPGEVDLGDVLVGSEPRVGKFIVSNRGDAPLQLIDWSASCGCAAVEWDQVEIATGAATTGAVTIKNFKDEQASGTALVYLVCNDPKKAVHTVRIRWTLVRTVSFEPQELTLSPDQNGNLVGEATLYVAGSDQPEGQPRFSGSLPALEMQWTPTARSSQSSPDASRRAIGKVSILGTASKFEDEGYGLVNVSFSGTRPSAALQVRWRAAGGLRFEPRRFALTRLAPNAAFRVEGSCLNSALDVQVKTVDPPDAGIRWQWTGEGPSRCGRFQITGNASRNAGIFTRKIRLGANGQSGTVEIIGFVVAE